MRSQEQMMIEAQARHISRLTEELQKARGEIGRLAQYETAGRWYLAIQKLAAENPMVAEEWVRFVAVITLVLPDEKSLERYMDFDADGSRPKLPNTPSQSLPFSLGQFLDGI